MKRKRPNTEKPYNRCLSCVYLGNKCDGPRTSAMSLERWCEFMRDMKELNGLTNAEIADQAEVSLKTIDRLMSFSCNSDIMRDTARRIENVIIGSANRSPCFLSFEEEHPNSELRLNEALRELDRAVADNKDYHSILDGIQASHNAELSMIREDAQQKINYLLEDINRMRKEIENLWSENLRKSAMIDSILGQPKNFD